LKEKKNKTDLVMTGSLETAEHSNEQETTVEKEKPAGKLPVTERVENISNIDSQQVADIMEQILSLSQIEKDLEMLPMEPGYVISLEKNSEWFYSITRRSFFEIKNGSEILSIEKIDNNKSQCLINSDVFEVDNDLILCVGWN